MYLARGADPTGGTPDINEAGAIGWVPLREAEDRLVEGGIVGAGSVAGLLAVLLRKARGNR